MITYQFAEVCYICGRKTLKEFPEDTAYGKVRDQCHYTGKYRSEAHSICNLRFNAPN